VVLAVDDAGFVRAPLDLVYRRVTDIRNWPSWWSGTEVRPLPSPAAERLAGDERWGMEVRAVPGLRLRLELTPLRWRHEAGFDWRLDGDLRGRGEFWLERAGGGTVVHHLLVAESTLRWPTRVHRGYRRAVRRGLWGLKDVLHLEARTSMGLVP
jgi:hypothetical protein